MRTDEDSEIEYTVVRRVASVTIDSDSQAEGDLSQRSGRSRRKKRVVKRKGISEKMDIDTLPQPSKKNKGMDWDGLYSTSELSSSESCLSYDGREADDEQSDWVGPADVDHNFPLPQSLARQQRFIKTRAASVTLQRKIERFIRDENQRELIVKHWNRYRQAHRVLQFFGLEVVKKGCGAVILKKTR